MADLILFFLFSKLLLWVVDPVYHRQLLRPPQLRWQLSFAREAEKVADGGVGGGGGGDRRRGRCLLVSCGDGSGSKKLLLPKMVSWEHLWDRCHHSLFHGGVVFTHHNVFLLHDPREPSCPQKASW